MNINTEWYFQSTPWPLMVVDLEKKIIFLNKSYEKMYDIQFINAKGKTLREAFNLDRAKEYEEEIDECIKSGKLKNYDAVIDGKYIECKMFPIFDEN
ncbi:MAG: PAS domain-containing protein [Clostridium sp.]|nr:PAS domain-containing protein [Clostridium sp.]